MKTLSQLPYDDIRHLILIVAHLSVQIILPRECRCIRRVRNIDFQSAKLFGVFFKGILTGRH